MLTSMGTCERPDKKQMYCGHTDGTVLSLQALNAIRTGVCPHLLPVMTYLPVSIAKGGVKAVLLQTVVGKDQTGIISAFASLILQEGMEKKGVEDDLIGERGKSRTDG